MLKLDAERLFMQGEKSGCQLVELYLESGTEANYEVRNKEVEKVNESKSQGLGIRVIKNNRQSLVYTNNLEKDNLEKSLEEAITMTGYLDEDEDLSYLEGEEFSGIIEVDKISSLKSVSAQEKMDYLFKIEAEALSNRENLALLESVIYEEMFYHKNIMNSKGLNKKEDGAYCGAYLALALTGDSGQETGDSYLYTRDIKELLKEEIGKKAYDNAKEMLSAKTVKTGKYTVIFDQEAVMSMLGLLASSFNGENIYKGKSMFKNKFDQEIISPLISIVDDGNLQGKLGTTYFDGDGVKTKRNVLVDRGVLKKGLYNLTMAKKVNKETTANCSRGYSSFPSIGTHSFFMENGETGNNELLKEMNDGLIIKDLMGLHMANPITGDFSLGASGLVVKNGLVVSAFRGVTVSGNLLTLFSQVVKVGSDLIFKVSKGAPSLLVEDVIISGD